MSVHLRLRVVLAVLIGALVVISFGTALQFRQLAISATELAAIVGSEASESADAIATQATTATIGLAILGLLSLAIGVGAIRSIRRGFLLRLHDLERAAVDIQRGDGTRRVPCLGDDELARIAQTINSTMDARDRCAAEMSGRNREMRALLVALLRQSSEAAAITGIDGEVLASNLHVDDDDRLRALTPQLRKAASILLSRGFASAAELATDVSFPSGDVLHIRALTLGEDRVVGWLAEFEGRDRWRARGGSRD